MIGEEDEVEFMLLFIRGHARHASVEEVVGAGPRGVCTWFTAPVVMAAGVLDEELTAVMFGRVIADIPAGFEIVRCIFSLAETGVLDSAVLSILVAVADDLDVLVAVASPIFMSCPTPAPLLKTLSV